MSYINFKSEYEPFPSKKMNYDALCGYDNIYNELKSKTGIICFDYYPGVDEQEVMELVNMMDCDLIVDTYSIFKSSQVLEAQMKYHLTDDRVFGKMYYGELIDFMDMDRLASVRKLIASCTGNVLIYGVGASIVAKADTLVYFDLARWQIQLRYRAGMPNYKAHNEKEDILRKYKRAFFIEWRVADKHKEKYLHTLDYIVDTNQKEDPKMITGDIFRNSLESLVQAPYRLVPYFDPGVWGGQWMKEVCNLDPSKPNYAWSFDGVSEENSLLFDYHGVKFEIPAMDLVLYKPVQLLGPQNYARFGAEFPIRFDFLDTMEGQNLSLQVHPLTDYIHKQFGMAYTQDESYYILDAKEDACVYLGLKENIDSESMISDLEKANKKEIVFDAEKYVNKFPAKKHDHFLIPAGTVHCSGSGAMVLEISATPYIFTFKLWDWERLGLDGLPRPVHIEHGKKNIQWNRTTKWVESNLVNATYPIEEENNPCSIEHTGLHELEFIETRRYTTTSTSYHDTNNTLNVLNLIDGKKAIVSGNFEPFEVHYAETFVIPACVGSYQISSVDGEEIKILKAYVRN